jgi:hypothetical protein
MLPEKKIVELPSEPQIQPELNPEHPEIESQPATSGRKSKDLFK